MPRKCNELLWAGKSGHFYPRHCENNATHMTKCKIHSPEYKAKKYVKRMKVVCCERLTAIFYHTRICWICGAKYTLQGQIIIMPDAQAITDVIYSCARCGDLLIGQGETYSNVLDTIKYRVCASCKAKIEARESK